MYINIRSGTWLITSYTVYLTPSLSHWLNPTSFRFFWSFFLSLETLLTLSCLVIQLLIKPSRRHLRQRHGFTVYKKIRLQQGSILSGKFGGWWDTCQRLRGGPERVQVLMCSIIMIVVAGLSPMAAILRSVPRVFRGSQCASAPLSARMFQKRADEKCTLANKVAVVTGSTKGWVMEVPGWLVTRRCCHGTRGYTHLIDPCGLPPHLHHTALVFNSGSQHLSLKYQVSELQKIHSYRTSCSKTIRAESECCLWPSDNPY